MMNNLDHIKIEMEDKAGDMPPVGAKLSPKQYNELISEIDENTKYTTLDGICYVVDYLIEQGYLKQPPEQGGE